MRGAAPDWSELALIHRPLMSVARVIRVSRRVEMYTARVSVLIHEAQG